MKKYFVYSICSTCFFALKINTSLVSISIWFNFDFSKTRNSPTLSYTNERRVLRTNKSMQRRPFDCMTKRSEVWAMRRSSGRPACDFVRSACGRAFGFASLTSLRRKLAVSTERLYFYIQCPLWEPRLYTVTNNWTVAVHAESIALFTHTFKTQHSTYLYVL